LFSKNLLSFWKQLYFKMAVSYVGKRVFMEGYLSSEPRFWPVPSCEQGIVSMVLSTLLDSALKTYLETFCGAGPQLAMVCVEKRSGFRDVMPLVAVSTRQMRDVTIFPAVFVFRLLSTQTTANRGSTQVS